MSVESAIKALHFLAEHKRPCGGEDLYNSLHLHQIADELEPLRKITQSDLVKLKRGLATEATLCELTIKVDTLLNFLVEREDFDFPCFHEVNGRVASIMAERGLV